MTFRLPLVMLAGLILCGCSDENYGSNVSPPPPEPYYIETAVTLSPDREYIYFVAEDTSGGTGSGLYRARVHNPARERVLAGGLVAAPTVSFDNTTIAYLEIGRIRYFDLSDSTMSLSPVADSFATLQYIGLERLLAGRGDTLFVIDDAAYPIDTVINCRQPSLYARDTFVCFSDGENLLSYIIKRTIDGSYAETLFTCSTAAATVWPTYHGASDRLAFGIEYLESRYIYSGQKGGRQGDPETFRFIDSTAHSKPYLIDADAVLFTGPDGRLYRTGFTGGQAEPFTFTGEGNPEIQ